LALHCAGFCHAGARPGKAGAAGADDLPTNDRHVEEMRAFPKSASALVAAAVLVPALLFGSVLIESPTLAFDLFATHEVTAQFATAEGKPMANAEVRVFAPGELQIPVETGHTDAVGKFVFGADRDGMWTAEARTKGEVARVMLRVGGPAQQQQKSWVSPIIVLGGLIGLLALAVWYRMLRLRNQRHR
jgi:hypothetical protein